MNKINFKEIIKDNNLSNLFNQGHFGIEKENLRTDLTGNLALTDFPKVFGNKIDNPYITVDFSESQIEMITPAFDNIEKTYNFLKNLNDIVSTNLENEYLWPQSIPCIIPEEDKIPIARFQGEEGKKSEEYRKQLAKKYGKKIQLISGIHYNFSFSKDFINILYKKSKSDLSLKDFKNELYLKTTRNFFKYGWLIIYLLGSSSTVHKSYRKTCMKNMEKLNQNSFYFDGTLSFRNGRCGYKNKDKFFISHDSVENYVNDIKGLIDSNILDGAREYYSPIRLKSKDPKNILDSLLNDGIEYLEIRTVDINPFSQVGVNLEDLKFIHLLLKYFAIKEEDHEFNENDYNRFLKNQELIANEGRNPNLEITCCKDNPIKITDYALEIIEDIKSNLEEVSLFSKEDLEILNFQENKIKNPENLYVNKLLKEVEENGYIEFHLRKAKEYLNESENKSFALKGYENLELSSQILLKEAIKRGITFEILDEEENFIYFNKNAHEEYVKQATKTSLDSYITMLIMENKVVTKKVLKKNGISVPRGLDYSDKETSINDFYKYEGHAIVIKPKSTNFGLGITIFKDGYTFEDYNQAIDLAFREDSSILIEEFISGKEYRFFVIGDEVAGILHRVPANVKGDGKSTIFELVKEKNKNPLRGKGYKTPLEKIKLGEAEELFLKNQNKTFDYIPKNEEIVYLRENSNISTGGDSIDYTDDIFDSYKKIAVAASKSANATICGVDMMIKDLKNPVPQGNYSIIEINFNPAIHIHCYPYIGKNRHLGEKILDVLGY